MSFGATIQGHAHPKIVEAVTQAMNEGSHFAAATPAEAEAAERFRRMVPTAEAVRFANTGSEATMLALRLARAHTWPNKIPEIRRSLPRLVRPLLPQRTQSSHRPARAKRKPDKNS